MSGTDKAATDAFSQAGATPEAMLKGMGGGADRVKFIVHKSVWGEGEGGAG